ncbi:uncharacterized protein LOC108022423 [Drosophila biarmipes]|uniref:uncharacterized protein LOC108022423 n=1 Tax=Drosophila biarmipes TaxID=125945 RepID=UPI0007E7C7BA|nr:uncharacterized protein LOC108022423 [Drosophila biarmipes]
MKSTLRLSTVLLLVAFACMLPSGSSSSSSTPKICVLKNCDWNSDTNVCGRYGRSNLCNRFKNSCALRYESCVSSSSVKYTTVSLSQCSGISVGSRGTCGGSSSSSSSSSNVTPIIIRRG